jgi:hypothetical protein
MRAYSGSCGAEREELGHYVPCCTVGIGEVRLELLKVDVKLVVGDDVAL